MKKSMVLWQFLGFVFTGVFGTLLHFVFDWTNQNIIASLFSAVNESIWEHMKLLYFPMLIFALFESRYLKDEYKNFWCGKTVGFLAGLAAIPMLYYTYTGALGAKTDWFNILIFFIAAAVSYLVETKAIKNSRGCLISPTVSKIFILASGVLFIVFTFLTPKIPLFEDPLDSTYGFFKAI